MIISKKHRFCFIKTHKTAGTSLEIALSKHCGDEDILTPMGGADEELRLRLSGRGAQNYRVRISDLSITTGLRALRHWHRPKLWNHASYSEALNFCSLKRFPSSYHVFAVERHPFEKVLSFYFHMKRVGFNGSFEEFCQRDTIQRVSDFSSYSLNGKVSASIYHYENLPTALSDIQLKTGLPKLELPKAKSGFRKEEIIEIRPPQKRIIRDVFSKEFEAFGYNDES